MQLEIFASVYPRLAMSLAEEYIEFDESEKDCDGILTCLLICTNDWYLNIDSGKYTSVTFIDLKKLLRPSIMIFY